MTSRSFHQSIIGPREHLGEPVPWLQAGAIGRSPELIGEVTDALVAFNSGDVLLHSGLHPNAFADPVWRSSRLSVPTMLLYTADGAVVAVEGANCGYGGAGPHAALDLLNALGFANADAVFDCRFLHLQPERIRDRRT